MLIPVDDIVSTVPEVDAIVLTLPGTAATEGAALIDWFDGSWVPLGVYTFVLAAITFATTFITPETRGRDLIPVEDALDEVKAGGVPAR